MYVLLQWERADAGMLYPCAEMKRRTSYLGTAFTYLIYHHHEIGEAIRLCRRRCRKGRYRALLHVCCNLRMPIQSMAAPGTTAAWVGSGVIITLCKVKWKDGRRLGPPSFIRP